MRINRGNKIVEINIEALANAFLVAHLDFSQLVHINRSFIPDNLREQESDIVYSVPFRSESKTEELLIYILIEHQSTVDVTMGFRVLFYMTQIWDFQRREWESNNVPSGVSARLSNCDTGEQRSPRSVP